MRTVSETSGAMVPSARHRTTAVRPREAIHLALALALAPLCVSRLDDSRWVSTPPGAAAAVSIAPQSRQLSRLFPFPPIQFPSTKLLDICRMTPREEETRATACASCGEHCKQCDIESVVQARKQMPGCTACLGKCVPRMFWVGRKTSVTVHTVGYGAAAQEEWHYNAGASMWEIGLRTSLPTNPKRNRFQHLEGHRVRLPAGSRPSSHTLSNRIQPHTPARRA